MSVSAPVDVMAPFDVVATADWCSAEDDAADVSVVTVIDEFDSR